MKSRTNKYLGNENVLVKIDIDNIKSLNEINFKFLS